MRNLRFFKMILLCGLAVSVFAGCSALVNINERAISIEDVINMTVADISPDIIIRQIEVTRSRFRLDADQIIWLKEAGVEDKVIETMIDTAQFTEQNYWDYGYSPYEYSSNYYNQWYPSFYYYPRGSPYYNQYHSVYPYVVSRRRDFIGRFYRYTPIVPPSLDNRMHDWRDEREEELYEEEER
jgi:hypothetical protein